MQRQTIAVAVGWAALFLASGAGCRAQPLSRQEQVQMLLARNRRLEGELLEATRQLAEATGRRPSPAATEETPQPVPEDPFRAIAFRFGKYTGGLDTDGKPGDDRLKVTCEPLDAEGDLVKRAGDLELEVLELVDQKTRPFARWKWSHEELAKAWLSGLGIYCYVLKLPWPEGRVPQSDQLLLRAKFTTLSGEVLKAEKQITIRRAPAPPNARGSG